MTEGERECERVKGVLKKGVLAREEDKGWEKGRKGERRRKRLREGEKRQERVREEECQNIAANWFRNCTSAPLSTAAA